MGPLGVIAGRATDRSGIQFCNGITPGHEERCNSVAERPNARVLLDSSMRRMPEERTPSNRPELEPAPTVYHTARMRGEDSRCPEDTLTNSKPRTREQKTLQFDSENSEDDDVFETRSRRIDRANKSAKVGQTQHSPAKRSHSSSGLRCSTSPDPSPRMNERARSLCDHLTKAYTEVRYQLRRSAGYNERYYDIGARLGRFSAGQWAWYFNPRKFPGRQMKWTQQYEGPYLVLKMLSPLVAKIQQSSWAKPKIVHIDKLKNYEGAEPKMESTARIALAAQRGSDQKGVTDS